MIKNLAVIFALLGSLVFVAAPVSAYDILKGTAVNCSGDTANSAVCQDKKTSSPIAGRDGIIYKITLIVAQVAGFAAVIIIIVAGIKYITSRGDSNAVASAKNTLIGAAVGLAVIALAASIITFAIGRVT